MDKFEKIPMPVKGVPFEHQKNAYGFVCSLFGLSDNHTIHHRATGAALLMEMGTGKTLTAIAVAGQLFLKRGIRRVLIVTPLSTVNVWAQEFKQFADFPYSLEVLSGSCEKKMERIQNASSETDGSLKVLVINYESAWRLESELVGYNAQLVIADEGHRIKEPRTRQSKALHHLGDCAPYRLLLTGTLITNKELDVWSQYRFVEPEVFGTSFYRFRNTFFEMTGYGHYTPVFRQEKTEAFLQRLHSIAYRVTKAECLDLPETTEEKRLVDLEHKAMRIYTEIEKENIAQLENTEVSAVNILTKLLRLSQVTGGYVTDDEKVTSSVSVAKLNALEDIVDSTLNDGKKLVVIAHFTAELDGIQAMLERKGVRYSCIRGGTKDRDKMIDNFQNDPLVKVFLGQIATAGLGITLTAASTMVFFSLSYSMSDFEQAKARIHRAGQRNTCHYIYLIAKGTVDNKVLNALRNKTDLAKSLVDDWRNTGNPFSEG